ncbi:MAG: 23S rRNA (pseudouridine(1915)-N(3))-methyltransferase RlmH [Polyangiales bacterium]
MIVVAVGKKKMPGVSDLLKEYYGRLSRYTRFEEVEIKNDDHDALTASMQKIANDRSVVVAMEVDGKAMTSEKLSAYIERQQNDGIQKLIFVIGGAYGLPRDLSNNASIKLSLSAMTLPHQLARVVLAEQLYRAFSILAGDPYNH